MELTRRQFLKGTAASLLGGPLLATACKPRNRTLNILNWAGYLADEPISRFEQQTGIAVNHETYFSDADLFARLSGEATFDLVVTSGYLVPRLKALKWIAPIPHGRLPRLVNIGRSFRDPEYDKGLEYAVPYLWGTTGLGFNTKQVRHPPSSWQALWDEHCRGRIAMLDEAREAIQCALLLLGLPLDSGDPAHLAKAGELLQRQRALLKAYNSSTYADELASGELWLAQSWNGDVVQAAHGTANPDFVLPKEGGFLWVDNLCFGRDGVRDESIRFVDYVLDPKVAAEISAASRYATPNEKALPLLDAAFRADPRVFPPKEAVLHRSPVLSPAAVALWRKTWDEIRRA